jgi:hypothetical protein
VAGWGRGVGSDPFLGREEGDHRVLDLSGFFWKVLTACFFCHLVSFVRGLLCSEFLVLFGLQHEQL